MSARDPQEIQISASKEERHISSVYTGHSELKLAKYEGVNKLHICATTHGNAHDLNVKKAVSQSHRLSKSS